MFQLLLMRQSFTLFNQRLFSTVEIMIFDSDFGEVFNAALVLFLQKAIKKYCCK